MQDLSYHSGDPVFQFGDLSFSIQLYTFENVYALDPAYCTLKEEGE